jgi:hypothetical protein
VHRAVAGILASDVADIEVVVTGVSDAPARPGQALDHMVFDLYRRFDTYWFKDGRPDPFTEMDLEPLLAGIPRVTLGAVTSEVGVREHLGAAPGTMLDIGVRFGPATAFPNVVEHTRLGVLSYAGSSDGDQELDSGPPGYREVLTGDPVTRSALLLDTSTGTRVVYESFASTASLSGWKNRREVYWKASAFVLRKLRELAGLGDGALAQPVVQSAMREDVMVPGNAAMLGYLPRLAARYVSTQLAMRTSFDQWFIAYRFRGADASGSASATTSETAPDLQLGEFTRLIPPKDRIWADPFPIVHQGRHFIFLEELLFARSKGHISVLEFDANGAPTRPREVLRTENHLSYPFLLSWKGETFMIPESARADDNPETAGSRGVPVFRANRFPDEWVQDSVMLEGLEAFDPTLVEISGVWWLFCTQAEPGASTWDELHLFHAPTPFGPWTPHRRNPVKSDVRSARPAGRPYRHNGAWYRPAQNCSVRYGYGLSINRIDTLTPTEYREVEVASILPDWAPDLIATHTLNAAGRLTVTDARMRRRRWSPEAPVLPDLHPAR